MEAIKVFLVEDDPVWRKGLIDYLNKEPGLAVVGEAGTKAEAVERFLNAGADIVLMDINLTENNLDGIETAMELISLQADCKIIMLTSLTAEDVIVESFSAGAVNYISKSSFKEIPEAIRAAHNRQSAIHPTAAAALRNEFLRLKNEENQKLLSPAEKDILQLIHQGKTQTQIEQSLHITKRTIKNHINRILKKMGVKTSKEAASKASQKKLF
ncbi:MULTISPECIES: response regulator transcription factor [Brevibacillus]|jgi:Response regulator containing a CheY-like receiver domain and an HTH DNA-binding domain|uniref:Transcriptional regulatory protein DevR n=1 Tax=Brevibacillus parabrevis TaxID=54914 RepID=A0A4Y3PTP4_BREPA|nr:MULTISPECIES: response regulator transcription factor [Brevibacillus]MDH6351151.1 two-component system response regulator DevR [Brevibacillus sp. 1238]MED2255906.1 response regulator transcription factor [Brevibacillus parabrevis]RNB97097.1 DNA-binding response regulator [Brevibacillus parabrevis]UED68927.1 response regulator transcription factor [Brevibacillus sp. HD3.3A]GEB33701.1 transcriptional regulatory protein DevR [Brevibacillus parabrevis]